MASPGIIGLLFSAWTGVYYGYDTTVGSSDSPSATPYGGTARYVNPDGGSNSGAGGIGSPWADLEYAMNNCTAGDSIYLRDGLHSYDIFTNNDVVATEANPVEIRSYPGEWAIIDGTSTSNGNLFRCYYDSWLIFRNFEIRNSDTSGISAGFAVEGLQDCEFHNLYIHDNHGSGIAGNINTARLKFYNVTCKDNYDVSSNGENADGFVFTAGADHEFYRCVSQHNSDDGFDFWASTGHYLEDCISVDNGYGTAGDGNGFKLGKVFADTPQSGNEGGTHTLVRCYVVGNATRGFDENGSTVANSFMHCYAYDSGQNWKMPNAAHEITNGISFDGGGDNIGGSCVVVTSKGQGFGGTVIVADFESVDVLDMNSTTLGDRFFFIIDPDFWP